MFLYSSLHHGFATLHQLHLALKADMTISSSIHLALHILVWNGGMVLHVCHTSLRLENQCVCLWYGGYGCNPLYQVQWSAMLSIYWRQARWPAAPTTSMHEPVFQLPVSADGCFCCLFSPYLPWLLYWSQKSVLTPCTSGFWRICVIQRSVYPSRQ